jgi:hypothetical protein
VPTQPATAGQIAIILIGDNAHGSPAAGQIDQSGNTDFRCAVVALISFQLSPS